jgi:hypothetical protein
MPSKKDRKKTPAKKILFSNMNSNPKLQTIPLVTQLSALKTIFLKISQQISDLRNSLTDSKITLRNSTQLPKKQTNLIPITTSLFLYQPNRNPKISAKISHTKTSTDKFTNKLLKARETTSARNTIRYPSVGSHKVEFLMSKTTLKTFFTTKIITNRFPIKI